ncbi:MAG: phosphatase PAP2 family protein [Candidatus Cloacimonetes bacterium]|nr:phosphatase PAP2 family protein [Candidatus Cloacimonadota bacterium]
MYFFLFLAHFNHINANSFTFAQSLNKFNPTRILTIQPDNKFSTIFTTSIVLSCWAYQNDNMLKRSIQKPSGANYELAENIFEKFGNGNYVFPALLTLNITGRVFDSSKAKDLSELAIKSSMLSCSIALLSKCTIGRARPYANLGSKANNDYNFDSKFHSFPSGHTTLAFTIAAAFSEIYCDKKWVQVLAYLTATGVGLSRVYTNKHWVSDICAGASLGILSVKLVKYNF